MLALVSLVALVALVSLSCGRVGFDERGQQPPSDSGHADTAADSVATTDAPPFINGSGGVVAAVGHLSDTPGTPTSQHLVFATDTQTWWLFYIDATGTTLHSAYSTDFVGWRAGTPVPLALPLAYGANFGVASKHINGTDVLHVVVDYTTGTETHDHLRGVLGATTIDWGPEVTVGCPTSKAHDQLDGPTVVIANDDRIYDFTSGYDDGNVCNGSDTAVGNVDATAAATPDTGGAWTSTWNVPSYLVFANAGVGAHWGAPLTGNRMLTVQADGTGDRVLGNLVWQIGSASQFAGDQLDVGSGSNVLGASLATPVDVENWGAVHVSDTDDLIVIRQATGAFIASRFDGTAWAAIAAPPAQPSKDAGGTFLASDGTDAWLFVIDTDAANTIRRSKFDGTSWGAWSAVETSPQSRSYLTGDQQVVAGQVGLLWSQDSGSGSGSATTYDLVAEAVPAQ